MEDNVIDEMQRRIERLERIISLILEQNNVYPNCEKSLLPERCPSYQAIASYSIRARVCPECNKPEFINTITTSINIPTKNTEICEESEESCEIDYDFFD